MTPLAGPVAVSMTLHPRMTQTGKSTKRRLDVDNAIKLTLDALNGVAYADDAQVMEIKASIGYPMPEGGLTVSVEQSNLSSCEV